MEGLHEVGEGVWGVDEIVWVCGGVGEIVWMMIRGRVSGKALFMIARYCIAWCGTSLPVEHLRLLSAPRCYKLSRMEKALPPAMHVELHMYVQGPRS